MLKKVLSAVSAAVLFFSIAPVTALAVDRYQVLQIGDEDQWVLELQKKLNQLEYLKVPATGYFGTDTQNAVVKFQQGNDLNADGKAGPATRQALLEDSFTEIPDTRTVKTSASLAAGNSGESGTAAGNALALGDKGDAISALQEKLKEYEYYEYDSITGYYGPVTEEAVKKFQRTHKLTEDGVMGQDSLDILNSDSVKYYTMYPGDRGDDILQMQERLKQLGYFSAEPTGFYGDATLTAVKMFQDNNSLSADGMAGKDTRKLLYSSDAKKSNGSSAPAATATSGSSAPAPTDAPSDHGGNSSSDPEPTAAPNPEPTAAPEPEPTSAPDPAPPVSDSTGVQKMLEVANSQIGKPYLYGASGPNSYDCSGFVYYVMKNSGIATSRLSSAGYASVSSWATISDVGSLAIGDLVFFQSDSSTSISHMGIYLGGGNFIHAAPSSGGVAISGMSSGYYSRNFVTAKRIF